jgi:hypothetical protein
VESYAFFQMLSKNVATSVAAFLFVVGCVTATYTGRGQLMLVSESNEIESGEEAYRHIMRDSVLVDNSDALRIVRKVGEENCAGGEQAGIQMGIPGY